jgi:hypothetical protein
MHTGCSPGRYVFSRVYQRLFTRKANHPVRAVVVHAGALPASIAPILAVSLMSAIHPVRRVHTAWERHAYPTSVIRPVRQVHIASEQPAYRMLATRHVHRANTARVRLASPTVATRLVRPARIVWVEVVTQTLVIRLALRERIVSAQLAYLTPAIRLVETANTARMANVYQMFAVIRARPVLMETAWILLLPQ